MKHPFLILALGLVGLGACREETDSPALSRVRLTFPDGTVPSGKVLFYDLETARTWTLDPADGIGTYLFAADTRSEYRVAAVYPADAPVTFDGSRITFDIPARQDGTPLGWYAGTAVCRPGGYEAARLTLEPLCPTRVVDLGRTPFRIKRLTVRPSDGSLLCGRTWFDLSSGARSASQSSVTVELDEPLDVHRPGSTLGIQVADPEAPLAAVLTFADGTELSVPDLAAYSTRINTPYPIGTSLAINSVQDDARMARIPAAGLQWVEVTCNSFWRNIPEAEWEPRAYAIRDLLVKYGLKAWSCHLPYSGTMDISVLDDAKRAENIALQKRMIRLCGELYHPKVLNLHPSSEPIATGDRARRLRNARAAIQELAPVAAEIGAVLCIENLPRTCLGRVTAEMQELIADTPEVMVTFDVNHLLIETHEKFFADLGPRIRHVHISDYDGLDERHALPGNGIIDWPTLHWRLRMAGFDGVFMYEVKSSAGTPAELVRQYHQLIFEE